MLAWWLHQRSIAGWGKSVEELRSQRNLCLVPVIVMPIYFLVLILNRHSAQNYQLPSYILKNLLNLRVFVLAFIFFTVSLLLVFLVLLIDYTRRVHRGKTMGTMIVWGKIFAVIPDLPRSLYVHLGATEEVAKWYALPAKAEQAVTGAIAQKSFFELNVLRGTGYILRLQRSGEHPLDLDFPVAYFPRQKIWGGIWLDTKEAAAKGNPIFAQVGTSRWHAHKQIGELRWYAYRRCGYWGIKSAAIGLNAFAIIFGSCFLLISTSVSLVPYSLATGQPFLLFFILLNGILLIMSAIIGIRIIPHWLAARRARYEPTTTMEGEVLIWTKWGGYSNEDKQGKVIKIKQENGQEHIFRVPYQFSFRAQQMGAKLSIVYYPTTERVVHVTDINELKQI